MSWSTDFVEQAYIEERAEDLKEYIIKQYRNYNVNINLTIWQHQSNRFIYKVKMKGKTREAHIRANAPDVRLKLKLPLFYVDKYKLVLCLIVSEEEMIYEHLPSMLDDPNCSEANKDLCLPYVVGHNVFGTAIMGDLAEFPHLLVGGSSNSGKSVGLQTLITSIAYSRSPSQVNFILIDVGATSLMPFEGLPHLSCPVIRDRTAAMYALAALNAEMERRIGFEYDNPIELQQLPRLVLVIDEFPALFMGGIDKKASRMLIDNVSSLLQRGRHAKIHLVLAAQNPTMQNMKIDLGNITARIAFKCAKKNFSETILGEGGAENLMGHGDMLLRVPRYDGPQRVQGAYITPEELRQTVQSINVRHHDAGTEKFSLVLSNSELPGTSDTLSSQLSCSVVGEWSSEADRLLASVIVWALGQDYISINMLMKDYNLGWNKASKLVKQLEKLGIVDKPEGKLPRQVISAFPEDLPKELITFLEENGYSENMLDCVCRSRIDD